MTYRLLDSINDGTLQLNGVSLSDTAIKNAKPNADKISDERGMYLLIDTKGNKYFRLDYRFNGKRKTLALGVYPDTSLKQARDKRDTAKKQIADGIDPNENKKAVKLAKATNAANSFEVVAREWFGQKIMPTKASTTTAKTMARLINDAFPWIGGRPIADLKAPEILALLRRIEDRGAIETAHRMLQLCSQILRYGISTGRLESDVTQVLRGALKPVVRDHLGQPLSQVN